MHPTLPQNSRIDKLTSPDNTVIILLYQLLQLQTHATPVIQSLTIQVILSWAVFLVSHLGLQRKKMDLECMYKSLGKWELFSVRHINTQLYVHFKQNSQAIWRCCTTVFPQHNDVIKWKYFPRYWPFVWGIHPRLVNSLMLACYNLLNKQSSDQSYDMPWCSCHIRR